MKRTLFTILSLLLLTASGWAQDKMEVKDASSNLLMQVNDEGAAGSITLPGLGAVPSVFTNKIYSIGGELYFNGEKLNTPWSTSGANIFFNSGSAGIGTATPNSNAVLDVDATGNDKGVLLPRLTTAQRTAISGLAGADEGLIVYDETTDSFWFWSGSQWNELGAAGGSDNLGNHTATQTLDLAGNDVSNADTVTATAFVGDGSGLTGIDTDDADSDPGNEIQNLSQVLTQGNDAGGADIANLGTVSATSFTGDGSGLTGVTASGDNLGDHAATQTLDLAGNDVSNADTVTATAFVGDGSGLTGIDTDDADSDPTNEIQNLSQVLTQGNDAGGASITNLGAVSAISFTGDGSGLTGISGDNLGNHTATQALNLANNNVSNGGTVTATAFVGDGSGLTGITGDNLGNHTATQALSMAGFDINNAGAIAATDLTIPSTLFARSDNNRVGVGVAAPETQLQLVKVNATSILSLKRTGTVDPIFTNFFAERTSPVDRYAGIGYSSDAEFRIGPISSITSLPSAGSGLLVDNTGFVGVGSAAPSVNLEVEGTVPEIRLTDNQSQASGDGVGLGNISWYSKDASFANGYDPIASIEVSNTNSTASPDAKMQFKIWDNSSTGVTTRTPLTLYPTGNVGIGAGWLSNDGDNEGISIRSDGKVGIGTINPGGPQLYVLGDLNSSIAAGIISNSNVTTALRVQGPANSDVMIVTDSDFNYLFKIAGSGNIGIQTDDPQYALQVGEQGDGTQARANAWNTFSDRRWKTDLEKIQRPLEKIAAINGYYYKWIDRPDTTRQVGVVAQEVEAVVPEVVATDAQGYKSVDYAKLTALLIEGMKEQQKTIAALEAQNRSYEKRFAHIEMALQKMNDVELTSAENK